MREKIREKEELRGILKDLKAKGKRIVFTNGCFDLLHVGHLRYLEEARTLGDVLLVAVNSDASVRRLKGPERPILPLEERMEILSGLQSVNFVTSFDESTPLELISSLQPHLLVKGGDWTKEAVVGREFVEGSGGEVAILPFAKGASTTNVIEVILSRYGKET